MLTRFNLIFLLFLFCTSLCAQKLDSIALEKLKAAAEIYDSTGYEAVTDLGGYYYSQHDQKNLRRYLLKEVEHAQRLGDRKAIISAYFHDILYHQSFSGKDSVFEASEFLLEFLEGDTSFYGGVTRVKAYTQIGVNFYYDYNDSENAYKYYRLAQDEALAIQSKDHYAELTHELSILFKGQAKYKEAIGLIDTALVKLEKFPGKELDEYYLIRLNYERATFLNAIADSTTNREEIYAVYVDMLNYSKEQDIKVDIVNNIEDILSGFGDYLPLDTLLVLGEEAIVIEKANRNYNPKLFLLHGRNLIKQDKYQSAKENLNIGLKQVLKSGKGYGTIAEIYDELTRVYLYEKNVVEAEKTFAKYKIYQDSAFIDERENELETITANYELDKKKTENIALKKQAETLSSRSKFLTIIGALLLSLLGIVFYFFQKTRNQAQKMEKLNETKNKIFTILAHDLKGPSLIFNNLAKKLNFLISKNDNTRLLEMAEYYEESGRKVSRIINGVLDWAIAEKDSFINNPEKIKISPILKNMIDDFKFELQQKNIKIDMDVRDDANIVFDKNAFHIINRNLMHNAIKFSPVDATINIKFDKQFKSLEYIDYGKGFDPEVANKILQMMPVKSSEGTMNEKGTGIGLVTCVKLLKENQGQMKIQSMTPTGTKIQVQFE